MKNEQRIFHSTGTFPELQSYKVKRYPPKRKIKIASRPSGPKVLTENWRFL